MPEEKEPVVLHCRWCRTRVDMNELQALGDEPWQTPCCSSQAKYVDMGLFLPEYEDPNKFVKVKA